jgi:hypothetical protein
MGRVRTKTTKRTARKIIERNYQTLTLDFHTNKRVRMDGGLGVSPPLPSASAMLLAPRGARARLDRRRSIIPALGLGMYLIALLLVGTMLAAALLTRAVRLLPSLHGCVCFCRSSMRSP